MGYLIKGVNVVCGTNDADLVSKNLHLGLTENHLKLRETLVNGVPPSPDGEAWYDVDVSDPQNIIPLYGAALVEELDSGFAAFFLNLCAIVKVCNVTDVTILTPGGRYMHGDDNVPYNAAAYYLSHRLYAFAAEHGFTIVNTFLKEWLHGTANLLPIHSVKDRVNLYCKLKASRNGAVHYCIQKYREMHRALFKVLDVLRTGLPRKPRKWEVTDGMYLHFLLGNKGAHITNGNICFTYVATLNPFKKCGASIFKTIKLLSMKLAILITGIALILSVTNINASVADSFKSTKHPDFSLYTLDCQSQFDTASTAATLSHSNQHLFFHHFAPFTLRGKPMLLNIDFFFIGGSFTDFSYKNISLVFFLNETESKKIEPQSHSYSRQRTSRMHKRHPRGTLHPTMDAAKFYCAALGVMFISLVPDLSHDKWFSR